MFASILPLLVSALPAAVDIQQYHFLDFTFQGVDTGNPFNVELAGEFIGPDSIRLRVPGFYDGDGVWKIRFSPTRIGSWEMRTVSNVLALTGKHVTGIACVPNRHPRIHGGCASTPNIRITSLTRMARAISCWATNATGPGLWKPAPCPHGLGIFNFTGRYTKDAFGDFLLGLAKDSQRGPAYQFGDFNEKRVGMHFQDDWQVSRNLTLNLGLRWDVETPFKEKNLRQSNYIPALNALVTYSGTDQFPPGVVTRLAESYPVMTSVQAGLGTTTLTRDTNWKNGTHCGAAVKARSNCMPSCANRSRFGVAIQLTP